MKATSLIDAHLPLRLGAAGRKVRDRAKRLARLRELNAPELILENEERVYQKLLAEYRSTLN